MGVAIGDLVVKKPISLNSLAGRVVAIDSFNMIYQFLASIRQEDGSPLMDFKGNVTAHLSGLFYRTCKFMESGLKPVYVFDGKPNKLKGKVQAARAEVKRSAEQKWKEALEQGKLDEAKKYAQATSKLTSSMIAESKQLIEFMGIPYVQAPSEGEAQASMMVKAGMAYTTASQDYDALLFGSSKLVRNLSITGRRKVPRQDRYVLVEPEEIDLNESLAALELDRTQLVLIGLLLGTDFNEGVKRVGPKTALKIVKDNKTLGDVVSYVRTKYNYEFEVAPQDVLNLFLEPAHKSVDPSDLVWKPIDKEQVLKLLVQEHDFSEDRVAKTIDTLNSITKERSAQSKIGDWF